MQIRFSPADEADFERLLALRILVMREHLERIGRFDPDRARLRFRAGFRPTQTRLIEADGAFAGCVTLGRADDHFELEHFYLTPDCQGRGIGAAVLARLLAEADAAGLPIRLGVLQRSPAARFYERHGFRFTGEDEFDVFYERPLAR